MNGSCQAGRTPGTGCGIAAMPMKDGSVGFGPVLWIGIAAARAGVREGLSTRVLLLSAFTDGPTVYAALEAGAAGFLSKESTPLEIVDAVLAVARGEKVLPSSLAGSVVDEIRLRSVDRP